MKIYHNLRSKTKTNILIVLYLMTKNKIEDKEEDIENEDIENENAG